VTQELEPKVGSYRDVPEEPVEIAENTTIRWLISRKDGAPNFAMRLFRIGPGGSIPSHSHDWEHEIFVLRGSGLVRIGEKEYRVSEGTFLFIPPNVEHYYENTGEGDLEFLCLIPLKGVPPEK